MQEEKSKQENETMRAYRSRIASLLRGKELKAVDWQQVGKEVYACALEHGHYDEKRIDDHYKMLIITEISEAVQADRRLNAESMNESRYAEMLHRYELDEDSDVSEQELEDCFCNCVKDSLGDEMADVVLRLISFFAYKKEDLKTLEFHNDRLAGCYWHLLTKHSFAEIAYSFCTALIKESTCHGFLKELLVNILSFAEACGVNICWHIEQKMCYNKSRPRLHGRRY